MLDRLRALFGERDSGSGAAGGRRHQPNELQLAVAALLVEAARLDGRFGAAERAVIGRLIERRLGFEGADADALVAAAEAEMSRSADLWSFARVVKNGFDYDERVAMIEMLWEVAYADGELHDYEASLLRRIAGLLYVSDQDSGRARKQVLERLGMAEEG